MKQVILMPQIFLFCQHLLLSYSSIRIPKLLIPTLISPAQTKGKVWCSTLHHLVERQFQLLMTIAKPIMVITESRYSGLSCQLCLFFFYLWHTQVVKAQVSRYLGLIMSSEQRLCLGHISPFRKTLSPPFVVMLCGMILG